MQSLRIRHDSRGHADLKDHFSLVGTAYLDVLRGRNEPQKAYIRNMRHRAAWIMANVRYVDRDGVHCCGPSDCRREHATKFRETPAGSRS